LQSSTKLWYKDNMNTEEINALLEQIAKAIETKQWHPGNVRGAINPRQAAELVREYKKTV
jgi:hypothetical protein